ncbi:cystic fibrosis transmembrane conductance regulator-like [Centruroides sculpturatus]|uniref:cystic fibrosis transmembrane conductance regulator-like n=1 Tax=Centruroides sculpturatus TaxID=218467 RepID=UPI000C6CBC4B|nr:cystic fibrosis transmembrane conductance regulator-like [Centruroides sculpturatus]
MDEKEKNNPFDSAGLFSRAFFCWLFPLLTKGRKRYLKQEDLYATSKCHTSDYLGNLLQKEWEKELKERNPRMLNAILRFLGWQFLIAIICALIQETVIIASQAYFLGLVINCFDHSSEWNEFRAYLSAAGFFGITAIYLFIYNFNFFVTEVLSMKLKIALLQAAILGDKRLNLLNEMIAGMRLIKMYTWEMPYAALIEKIRM